MFTGLVEDVGAVVACTPTAGGSRLRITSALARGVAEGESLAVNGVCLTAIGADGTEVLADLGPETLRATTLGSLGRGALVNLERPLRADGRVGGHFVQGHVDAVGRIDDIRLASEFTWVAVSFPPELAPYIVHKGSIAVDGISLTVAALEASRFEVQVVPFTLANTNLRQARVGDRVNLECDLIGKYVVRVLAVGGVTPSSPAHGRT
jgi:riboflavin synthase